MSEDCQIGKVNTCLIHDYGERSTLIDSVLDALPIYMMSIFPAPVNVIKRFDALRRNFFWHGSGD